MMGHCTRLKSVCALLVAVSLLHSAAMCAEDAKADDETTTLSGTLVDTAGKPIAGATLKVLHCYQQLPSHRELASGRGSGVSDADGRVKIENLPVDRIFALRFSHPDFPRYWFEVTTAKDTTLVREMTLNAILENGFRKEFDRPQKMQVKLFGNDGKSPLPGVVIHACPTTDSKMYYERLEWSAMGTTDAEGIVKLPLAAGRYQLSLSAARPLDCIELHEPIIQVHRSERIQTFLRMTIRGTDVVFKAVDADTGKPIAGVSFWKEMPEGEYWFEIVRSQTVGSLNREPTDEESRQAPYVTGADGLYRCQMCPSNEWTYHVHHCPEGYEEVDENGQKFEIPVEGSITRTFYLRKRAK